MRHATTRSSRKIWGGLSHAVGFARQGQEEQLGLAGRQIDYRTDEPQMHLGKNDLDVVETPLELEGKIRKVSREIAVSS